MMGHQAFKSLRSERVFQIFKYAIYTLIAANVLYFFYEDYVATGYTYRNGIEWSQLGYAFATSIDSFAWLVLLLLFELETYVLSDESMKGRVKWVMSGLVGLCYISIIIAYVGYIDRLEMAFDFIPIAGAACDHVGSILSYAVGMDEYFPLTAESCQLIGSGPLFYNPDVSILTDADTFSLMKRLTMTDVVNSGAWLLVVLVLQIDVILQLEGELTRRLYTINMFIKAVVYGTLVLACIYWATLGSTMNFWDAFLWIAAFIFIELNLFKWHESEESLNA